MSNVPPAGPRDTILDHYLAQAAQAAARGWSRLAIYWQLLADRRLETIEERARQRELAQRERRESYG